MLRSLYSAISGLRNHQTRMDVIGNNISNVNTTGFKRSRVTFSTMLSQTMRGASAPTANQGGTNPMQIGLGSNLASIDQIMTEGSTQYTGNQTDMMIQGSGFFVLSNNGETVYSRAGAFSLDQDGNLVDPGTGAFVQGFMFQTADPTESPTWPTSATPNPANYGKITIEKGAAHPSTPNTSLESFSIDQSGVITGVYYNNDTNRSETYKIAQIAIAQFNNDAGLTSLGNNFYAESNNSGEVSIGAAGESGRGSIIPSAVEMSNVDLAQEFTDMIVTQRGFQANSRIITVSDTLLQELIDLKR